MKMSDPIHMQPQYSKTSCLVISADLWLGTAQYQILMDQAGHRLMAGLESRGRI